MHGVHRFAQQCPSKPKRYKQFNLERYILPHNSTVSGLIFLEIPDRQFSLSAKQVEGLPDMALLRPSRPNRKPNAENAIQLGLSQQDVVARRNTAIEQPVEFVQRSCV